jgi:hypothetical protein
MQKHRYLGVLHSCAHFEVLAREETRVKKWWWRVLSAPSCKLKRWWIARESWIKNSGAHTHTYSGGGGLEGFPAAKMRPGSAYCAKYVCVLSARTQILLQRTAARRSMCLAFECMCAYVGWSLCHRVIKGPLVFLPHHVHGWSRVIVLKHRFSTSGRLFFSPEFKDLLLLRN